MTLKTSHMVKNIGGHGGDDSSKSPDESPNTLRSTARARILDLYSEGEVEGLQGGTKGIYLDEVPVENADGTFNFEGVSVVERTGLPDQTPMYIFEDGTPAESILNYELEQNVSRTVNITGWNGDYLLLKFMTPKMVKVQDDGDLRPTQIQIDVEYALDGGSYTYWGQVFIRGKCVSPYERQIRIDDLSGYSTITVRCTKITGDSETKKTRDAYWYSYTEVISERFIYPDTAYFGVTMDASLFGDRIPRRAYHVKGIKVQIPSNYNPTTREYTGVWDGTFSTAWTNNPAWIFYDILTNTRYGDGVTGSYSTTIKWLLYTIGQYCDVMVDDGYGSTEPRFTCNCVINTREEAFHVLHKLASVFNAIPYWGANQAYITQDVDSDPVKIFSPANVEKGQFNYEGTGLKARHTVAIVYWNKPDDFYRQHPEIVEHRAGIERYGWNQTEITAFGCDSRGQANRLGRWILETDLSAPEVVTFVSGFYASDLLPGNIIEIADPAYSEVRHGGRIKTPATGSAVIDSAFEFDAARSYLFTAVLPDASVETVSVDNPGTETDTFNLSSSFSTAPKTGADWILTDDSELNRRLWRVVQVAEQGKGKFQVVASYHDPDKYDRLNTDEFDDDLGNIIPEGALAPPTNIQSQEFTYQDANIGHAFGLWVGWEEPADARHQYYEVEWGDEVAVYTEKATALEPSFVLKPVTAGSYYFRVRACTLSRWSSWLESGEIIVTATQATLPAITGLQVVGGGTDWDTKHLEIEWDSILDLYLDGTISTVLKRYRIDIYTTADLKLRTDYVDRADPRYSYTFDKNSTDNSGSPIRSVKVVVRAQDIYLDYGAPQTVVMSNLAPDMSSISLTITDSLKGLLVSWDSYVEPIDLDYYKVYAGTVQATVEALDASVFVGQLARGTKRFIVSELTPDDTYYVVVVPYDRFGIGVETTTGTGLPKYVSIEDVQEELANSLVVSDSIDTANLTSLYDGNRTSGGINYGAVSWGTWIQVKFPVETLVDRVVFAASAHTFYCYVAILDDDGDTWTYYKADADHTIDSTGKLTEASGSIDAATNYYTVEGGTAMPVYLPLPDQVVGRYARLYIASVSSSFTLYELIFVRQILSEEIAADAIYARHISSDAILAEHLSANSVDGTTISASSEITLDEGGSATFGDGNVFIDTNPAGGGGNIVVAPDGGITGQDYTKLDGEGLKHGYYDSESDSHIEYQGAQRMAPGVVASGTTDHPIAGVWKNQPNLIVWALEAPTYDDTYSSQNQVLQVRADNISLQSGYTDRWKFDAVAELHLSANTVSGAPVTSDSENDGVYEGTAHSRELACPWVYPPANTRGLSVSIFHRGCFINQDVDYDIKAIYRIGQIEYEVSSTLYTFDASSSVACHYQNWTQQTISGVAGGNVTRFRVKSTYVSVGGEWYDTYSPPSFYTYCELAWNSYTVTLAPAVTPVATGVLGYMAIGR